MLALVSLGNERQSNVPMRVCPFCPRGIVHNGFADLRWGGVSAHMFVSRTAFSLTTKLSAEHETPPIANVPFAAGQSLLCCPLNKFNPVSKVNCLC